MIGQDCRQFESNIDKFILVFLKKNEDFKGKSFEKMRHVIMLYHLFTDLAQDVRAIHCDLDRINSFKDRAELFFKKFKVFSMGKCTAWKPYLRILREHIKSM